MKSQHLLALVFGLSVTPLAAQAPNPNQKTAPQAQPGAQPNPATKTATPGQPANPQQSPAQTAKPGQPGQPAQPGQPGQPAQQPGQPNQPHQVATAPAGQPTQAKGPSEPLHLKAFQTKNCSPELVKQMVQEVCAMLHSNTGAPGTPGQPHPGQPQQPGQPHPGQPQQAQGQHPGATNVKMYADEQNHTLYVRGTERELKVIGEIMAALEAHASHLTQGKNAQAGSKVLQEGKDLCVVRLHKAKMDEVQNALKTLGLNRAVTPLPEVHAVLILPSQDAALADVRSVIEGIDGQSPGNTTQKTVATGSD